MIRILIAEDHLMVRAGIRALLERAGDIHVMGEASNGEEHTSVEIGKMLFISEKTVEKHRARLMGELNVRNLAGLVRLAVKYHLVDKDL